MLSQSLGKVHEKGRVARPRIKARRPPRGIGGSQPEKQQAADLEDAVSEPDVPVVEPVTPLPKPVTGLPTTAQLATATPLVVKAGMLTPLPTPPEPRITQPTVSATVTTFAESKPVDRGERDRKKLVDFASSQLKPGERLDSRARKLLSFVDKQKSRFQGVSEQETVGIVRERRNITDEEAGSELNIMRRGLESGSQGLGVLGFDTNKKVRERRRGMYRVPPTGAKATKTQPDTKIGVGQRPGEASVGDKMAASARLIVTEDGSFAVDKSSLIVHTAHYVDPTDKDDGRDTVYEDRNHMTASSYTNRVPNDKWCREETDLFFRAVSLCGTDFTLMSQLLSHRTRRQLKNKFKREEKENPLRIDESLKHRVMLDETEFEALRKEAVAVVASIKEENELAAQYGLKHGFGVRSKKTPRPPQPDGLPRRGPGRPRKFPKK